MNQLMLPFILILYFLSGTPSAVTGESQSCSLKEIDSDAHIIHFGEFHEWGGKTTEYVKEGRDTLCVDREIALNMTLDFVNKCYEGKLKSSIEQLINKAHQLHDDLCWTKYGREQYFVIGKCVMDAYNESHAEYQELLKKLEAITTSSQDNNVKAACCFTGSYGQQLMETIGNKCKGLGDGIKLFNNTLPTMLVPPEGCSTVDSDCKGLSNIDATKTPTYMTPLPYLIQIMQQ